MKKLKLFSVVLSFILVLNIFITVNNHQVDAATNVAYVWVIGCSGDGTNGHGFIAVKNVSSSSITVGKYSLGAGKIVTLGTFGNLKDGSCLYYNVEKYRMVNDYCSYTPSSYIGMYITSSELTTLNSTINSNTSWTLTNNCTSFAQACWNSISANKIYSTVYVSGLLTITNPVGLPSILQLNIEKYSYSSDFSITGTCAKSDVKYQTSSTASIKTASLSTTNILESASGSSSQ